LHLTWTPVRSRRVSDPRARKKLIVHLSLTKNRQSPSLLCEARLGELF
jgi:hypothetical protein